jgi:hypothetical protein
MRWSPFSSVNSAASVVIVVSVMSPAASAVRSLQRLRAVGEQRRKAFAEVELTGIELSKQRDELSGRTLLARGDGRRRVEEVAVGQESDGIRRHACVVARVVSAPLAATTSSIAAAYERNVRTTAVMAQRPSAGSRGSPGADI